jgi:hypothetical protein
MSMREALLMLTVICTIQDSAAQWSQTNGPYGGDVRAFAAVSNQGGTYDLFAGCFGGGVFRSTNYGDSWTQANAGLGDKEVLALAASGEYLFAGTNSDGVFVSTDRGGHWTSTGLKEGTITSLAIFSPEGEVPIVLAAGTRIYASTDYGASWTGGVTLTRALGSTGVYALSTSGANIFAGTSDNGVYLSTDKGASWVQTGLTNMIVYALAVMLDETEGVVLFAGSYHTVDNGTSWIHGVTGLTDPNIQALAVSGTALYAGTNGNGVFRSTDVGMSWAQVSSGLKGSNVRALVALPDGMGGRYLFAGSNGGVNRSADNGASWAKTSIGMTGTTIRALVSCPDGSGGVNLFAGTDGGVSLSTDNGTSWTQDGFTRRYVCALAAYPDPVSGSSLYAGTWGAGIYRSTDDGSNWTDLGSLREWSNNIQALTVLPGGSGGSKILAGTLAGLQSSTDNGVHWSWDPWIVRSIAVSETYLFIGGNFGVCRSSDTGETFNRVSDGLWSNFIPALATLGTNVYAGSENNGFFISTDNGTTWVQRGLIKNPIYALAVASDALGGALLYAGTRADGIFITTNSGVTWSSFNAGLTSLNVPALKVSGGYIFAGTYGSGVWRRPLGELTSVKGVPQDVPLGFSLEQNYPNPFNPTTRIGFGVSGLGARVKLAVYDLLGREVAVLVDEKKEPGSYEVQFDGRGLASGVYVCRLQVAGYVKARKLALVR